LNEEDVFYKRGYDFYLMANEKKKAKDVLKYGLAFPPFASTVYYPLLPSICLSNMNLVLISKNNQINIWIFLEIGATSSARYSY